MRRITEKEIKPICLEILRHVKQLCEAEGITFYLGYGTALGAIRHHGFIPWDDDIDIFMFRPDFERYLAADKRIGGRYRLVCTQNQPGYTLPLPKVIDTNTTLTQTDQIETFELGVYIDVFVLDAVPENESRRKTLYRKMDRLHHAWAAAQYVSPSDSSFVKRAAKELMNRIGPRRFSVRLDELSANCGSLEDTKYVCPAGYSVYGREIETYPRNWFGATGRICEFNGMELTIPDKCEEYLTRIYGDYMKLPPVEQRVSHHCFEAYWKD